MAQSRQGPPGSGSGSTARRAKARGRSQSLSARQRALRARERRAEARRLETERSLRADLARALRRVISLYPTAKAVAPKLGLTESRLSAYAHGRLPKRVAQDEALLEELMSRAAAEINLSEMLAASHDMPLDDLARSSQSEKRAGKRLADWERFSARMLRSSEVWQLGERRRVASEEIAAQLGRSVKTVREWISRGRVPSRDLREFYLATRFWPRPTPEAELGCTKADMEEMRRLMALARRPGYSETTMGAQLVQPIYPFRSREKRTESDFNIGYEWAYRIGKFLSADVLDEMVELCRKARLPRGYRGVARRWDHWMVTAVVVEYTPPGTEFGPPDESDRNIVRFFGEIEDEDGNVVLDGGGSDDDNETGGRMVINQGRSGSVQPTRKLAIAAFIRRIDEWMQKGICIWVQGVILRNWRRRTDEERAARLAAWQHEAIEQESQRLARSGLLPPGFVHAVPDKRFVRGLDGERLMRGETLSREKTRERRRRRILKELRDFSKRSGAKKTTRKK